MKKAVIAFVAILGLTSILFAEEAKPAAKAPPYVWGKAFYILEETTSDQSGYFSLNEGLNGRMYVGTAKYGVNGYLVEFDPKTEKQKIVIDTHKLCGITNTGYASQSKIHTRNFVGPSGKIYVGSKQGYRRTPEDALLEYPGGYVMTYDPKTEKAENLGMPYPTEGVIDTTADESRDYIYVVTCETQHWMLYDGKTKKYRELGPLMTGYATTLLDNTNRAHCITKDFKLATYDPTTDKVQIRDIVVDGVPLSTNDLTTSPITWISTPDRKGAYLIRMSDPTLFWIDLSSNSPTVPAKKLCRMIEGKGFDSRCALTTGPDGRVYAVIRVDNDTGFGSGYLHHLLRYDSKTAKTQDLGVLAVKNPDFFDWSPLPDGTQKPWTHGFHKLPDGTMTPLHNHMGLIVAHDGTIYVTIIYPYTLLQIPAIP